MAAKTVAFAIMLLILDVEFSRGTGQSRLQLNEATHHNLETDEKGLPQYEIPGTPNGDGDIESTIELESSSKNRLVESLTNSLNLTSEDLKLGDQAVKSKRWIFGNDDRKRLLPYSLKAQQTPHSAACKLTCKGWCSWSCSGILIGSRHVLTSAHCLDGETVGALRIGFLERNGRLSWYNVITAYVPSRWTALKALASDYAVLKLRRPPKKRSFVQVASLALSKGSLISFTGFPGDKVRNSLWTTGCSVLLVKGGVIYNKCDAARGSSGSGVFVTDSSGTKVVGVLSAETKSRRLNVAVYLTRSKVNQINGWTRN